MSGLCYRVAGGKPHDYCPAETARMLDDVIGDLLLVQAKRLEIRLLTKADGADGSCQKHTVGVEWNMTRMTSRTRWIYRTNYSA